MIHDNRDVLWKLGKTVKRSRKTSLTKKTSE